MTQITLRLRLKDIPHANRQNPFDISRLKKVSGAKFRAAPQNHFNGLHETATHNASTVWPSLKSSLTEVPQRNRDWAVVNTR